MHRNSTRIFRNWFLRNRILNFNLVLASDIPATSPISVEEKSVGGGGSKSILVVPPPNAV
jgi:hypothetical protein